MTERQIAGHYVTIAIKGMKEAVAEVTSGIAVIHEQFTKIKTNVGELISSVKSLGLAFGGLGGAFLALSAKGLENTLESQRLSASWEYLSRLLADQLAPYVRAFTSEIVSIAEAYRSLNPQTKEFITSLALTAAGVAAVIGVGVALGVVVTASIAAIGAAFAVLTSPITGFIALMGAAGYAIYKIVQEVKGWFGQASTEIQDSNRSWIQKLASGIADVVVWVAEKINWLMRQVVGAYSWVTSKATWVLEKLGAVQKGTYDLVKNDPFKPWQINVEELRKGINGLGGTLDSLIPTWSDLKNGALEYFQHLREQFNKVEKGGGAHIKYTVAFESSTGTYDRLSQTFTGQANKTEDLMRAQLGKTDESNKILNDLGRWLEKIAGKSSPPIVS